MTTEAEVVLKIVIVIIFVYIVIFVLYSFYQGYKDCVEYVKKLKTIFICLSLLFYSMLFNLMSRLVFKRRRSLAKCWELLCGYTYEGDVKDYAAMYLKKDGKMYVISYEDFMNLNTDGIRSTEDVDIKKD